MALIDRPQPTQFWYVQKTEGEPLPNSRSPDRVRIKRSLEKILHVEIQSIQFDKLDDGYVISVRKEDEANMEKYDEVEILLDGKRFLFSIENPSKPKYFVFVNQVPLGWGVNSCTEYFQKIGSVHKVIKVTFDGAMTTEAQVQFHEKPRLFEQFGDQDWIGWAYLKFEGQKFGYKRPKKRQLEDKSERPTKHQRKGEAETKGSDK